MRSGYLGPLRAAQDLEDVVRAHDDDHHRHIDQHMQSPINVPGC